MLLMTDLGGADSTVANDLGHQRPNESLALVSRTAQVLDAVAVAHHGPLHPRGRSGQRGLCRIQRRKHMVGMEPAF